MLKTYFSQKLIISYLGENLLKINISLNLAKKPDIYGVSYAILVTPQKSSTTAYSYATLLTRRCSAYLRFQTVEYTIRVEYDSVRTKTPLVRFYEKRTIR